MKPLLILQTGQISFLHTKKLIPTHGSSWVELSYFYQAFELIGAWFIGCIFPPTDNVIIVQYSFELDDYQTIRL